MRSRVAPRRHLSVPTIASSAVISSFSAIQSIHLTEPKDTASRSPRPKGRGMLAQKRIRDPALHFVTSKFPPSSVSLRLFDSDITGTEIVREKSKQSKIRTLTQTNLPRAFTRHRAGKATTVAKNAALGESEQGEANQLSHFKNIQSRKAPHRLRPSPWSRPPRDAPPHDEATPADSRHVPGPLKPVPPEFSLALMYPPFLCYPPRVQVPRSPSGAVGRCVRVRCSRAEFRHGSARDG